MSKKLKKCINIFLVAFIIGNLMMPTIIEAKDIIDTNTKTQEINVKNDEVIDFANNENYNFYKTYTLSTETEVDVYQVVIDNSYIFNHQDLTDNEYDELTEEIEKQLKLDIKSRQAKGVEYSTTPDGKVTTYYTDSGKTHSLSSGTTTKFGQDDYMKYNPTGQIVFCLDMMNEVGSITSTTSAADYNTLNPIQKQNVDDYGTIARNQYYKTDNEDYLFAGQLLIWEQTNSGYSKNSWEVQSQYNTIKDEKSKIGAKPSFSNRTEDSVTQTHKLEWDGSKYSITLTDSNGVWDSNYSWYGTVGDYTLSNPTGKDNVKITTTNHNAKKTTLTPSNTGGLEYNYAKDIPASKRTPLYLSTTGQDLTTGNSDPVKIKFSVEIIPAFGKGKISKKLIDQSDVVNGSEDNQPLAGAVFGIYEKDTDKKVGEVTTNTNGIATTPDLVMGDYYFKEIKAPTGYNLNPNKYYFTIKPGETVSVGNIDDKIIKGKVHLKKVGTNSNPFLDNTIGLEGAEFEITDTNTNKVVETIISDENGNVTSSWLKYGNYKICETKAPNGYIENGWCEEFSITEEGKTIELNSGEDLYNQIKYGKMFLNKDGESLVNGEDDVYYPLANVFFDIYWDENRNGTIDSDEQIVQTLVTDEHGYAESKVLKGGEQFILIESDVPEPWVGDYTEIFEVTEMGQIIVINYGEDIENKAVRGQVEINKVSDSIEAINGEDEVTPLGGAEYGLWQDMNANGEINEDEDIFIEKLITDENGYAISNQIKYGNYLLQETKAPEGHKLDDTVYAFSIINDGEVVQVNDGEPLINKVITGQVELTKVGETNGSKKQCRALKDDCIDNKPLLEGAEFSIYEDFDRDGRYGVDDLAEVITTDQGGHALSSQLKYGHYIIIESKAPEGYKLSDTIYEFDIVNDKEVVQVNGGEPIINEYLGNFITIHKEDQNGNPVEGAEFTIYSKDKTSGNKVVDVITTNEEGIATSKKLKYGAYYMEETKVPVGYEGTDEIIDFIIDENDTEKELTFTVENTLITNKIIISKEDENGKEIPGAELEITDEAGNVIDKWISTEEKHEVEVGYGKYSMCETMLPEGYTFQKNDPETACVDFEVTENGIEQELVMINERIKGSIELLKVDSKDETPLEGAEFGLYVDINENGKLDEEELIEENLVAKETTDKDGRLTFNDIYYGKYITKEIKAPKGYELDENLEIPVQITEYGQVVELIATNEKIVEEEFLETGKRTTFISVMGTIVLVSFITGIYYYKSRKEIK